ESQETETRDPSREGVRSSIRIAITGLRCPAPERERSGLIDGTVLAALTPGRALSMTFDRSAGPASTPNPLHWRLEATGSGVTPVEAEEDARRLSADLSLALRAGAWAPELTVEPTADEPPRICASTLTILPPRLLVATPRE